MDFFNEDSDNENEYGTATCQTCKIEIEYEATIQREFSDSADVVCPKCLKVIDTTRCDIGSPKIIRIKPLHVKQ